MKNLLITFTILTALLTTTFTNAETAKQKQWSVGISSYALIIDSDYYGADDFIGFAISSDYAISDNFAIRGAYYSLEHEDFSEIEVNGFEFLGYYGTGLMSQGFKAYIGGGLYTETLEASGGLDEDFSGVQLNGGIGYNWESVALDLSTGIRTTGDYEDFYDGDDLIVTSGSLTLSFRF